jgi:hypothetical protein
MNVGIVTSMWSFENISSCRLILWIKLHRVSPNVGQWQDIGFASISQRVLWPGRPQRALATFTTVPELPAEPPAIAASTRR